MSLPRALATILSVGLFILIASKLRMHIRTRRRTISAPEAIRDLLDPPHTSPQEVITQRALANVRLVKAFKLNNGFTAQDIEHAREFRLSAIQCIQGIGHAAIQEASKQAVDAWFEQVISKTQDIFPVDSAIQYVTFATIVHCLFEVPVASLSYQDVRSITYGINALWCISKYKETDSSEKACLCVINDQFQTWLATSISEIGRAHV